MGYLMHNTAPLLTRFIYTGEVSVPQHDLQDFLRTAELLEIKGLLKNPSCGSAEVIAPSSPNHQSSVMQSTLCPTVPVSPFLLAAAAAANSPTTTTAAGTITNGGRGTTRLM